MNHSPTLFDKPALRRWESILGKDTLDCAKARCKYTLKTPNNKTITFAPDGTLKDVASIKQTITSESEKFFMNLEATPTNSNESIEDEPELPAEPQNLLKNSGGKHKERSLKNSMGFLKPSSKHKKKSDNGQYISSHEKFKRSSTNSSSVDKYSHSVSTRPRRKSVESISKNDISNHEGHPKIFKRQESISKFAIRHFDYNDPHLQFEMSPNGPVVMGGTKEKLISLLTDISVIEIRYVTEFLGVYPYFATCSEVLNALRVAYQDPKIPNGMSSSVRAYKAKIRRRVLFVLTRWLQNYPRQFYDSNCITDLREFLEELSNCPEKTVVVELFESRVLSIGETFDFLTPRVITDKTKSPLFLKKPHIIAEQLCLLDQRQFCQIEVHELKNQVWNNDNSFNEAPNTTRCIEFFNRVSYWCATEIISQRNLKQRTNVLKIVIQIAYKCLEYKNYNTLFAIVSALNFSAISRLKATWKALSSKYMDMFKEMEELCDVKNHYFPYKKRIAAETPPLVPYVGVFLRDLTFIEVGNPSYLDQEESIINYDKFRMLAAVLEDIRKYQQISYDFQLLQDVQTSLRVSMLTLDADELFNLSRIVEPPTGTSSPKVKRLGSGGFVAKIKRSLDTQ